MVLTCISDYNDVSSLLDPRMPSSISDPIMLISFKEGSEKTLRRLYKFGVFSPLDILSAFISGLKRSNSSLSVVHMFLNSVPLFLSCAIDQVEMKGRPGSSFNEEINSSCE